MKVKKLIEELQKADPTGEEEVSVGNIDIFFVSAEPSYYDGSQQVLIRDETNEYYNIIGAKYRSTGTKIVINTHTIGDAIFENVDLPIDYSDLASINREISYREHDNKTRKKSKDIYENVHLNTFQNWAKERAKEFTSDFSGLNDACEKFYKENLSYDEKIPEDLNQKVWDDKDKHWYYRSMNDRYWTKWDREIEITSNGMDWSIKYKDKK